MFFGLWQGLMKLLLLYCDFKKYLQSMTTEIEDLKKRLSKSKSEVARLRDLLEDQDVELLITGQQQSKATETNTKLQSRIEELTAELHSLQEDHSIVK
jgi:predicted nuclease with TOPRIM domain